MTENVKTYVTEKTKELIAAASCSAEAKEAANAWLEAVGTEKEAEVTKNYIAELEEDIMPIDGLIAFAGSDMGAKIFGTEGAAKMLSHAEAIKAEGARYCDCPACAACEALLEKKSQILK